MKKIAIFSLAAAALLTSFSANAEGRRWDFTKWSAATQSDLMKGAGVLNPESNWSDIEKATGSAPTDLSANSCFWQVTPTGASAVNENGYFLANGNVIAELEGLVSVSPGTRSLAIALNYQNASATDAAMQNYNGPAYLWLGGSKKNYFYIPNVELGTTIKMGVESHKNTDARGVELYAGKSHSTAGTKLLKEDGTAWDMPTTYTDMEWVVPAELDADKLNEDGTVDVLIYNTNGCHLYYIQVGEGEPDVKETKVAYLVDLTYNGYKVDGSSTANAGWAANGGLDGDFLYASIPETATTTVIDLSAAQTLSSAELNDSLLNFDVVVLCEAVASGNALAKGLKDIINMVPFLNLKSFMYKSGVWSVGAGANPSPKATAVKVDIDNFGDDPLFEGVTISEEGEISLFDVADVTALAGGNLIQGYTTTEGSLFEKDEVLATVGSGINAIHRHGTRNQYLLLPISSDNMDKLSEDALMLFYNAVNILAATKSKVQNCAAPVINVEQQNGLSLVTLTCSNSEASIHYTMDGTEPTEASVKFDGNTLTIDKDSTLIKAIAFCQGYNPSGIASKVVRVQSMLDVPSVSIAGSEGYTTITMSAAEGADVFYSFSGQTNTALMEIYTEPIVVTEPGVITALASSLTALPSESVTREVTVGGIPAVKDTIAHFTANQEDWFDNAVLSMNGESKALADAIADTEWPATGNAKAIYYFGKSAWNYYSEEVDHTEPVLDEQGNPVKAADGTDSIKTVYKVDPNALRTITSTTDTQWIIKTQGQVITGETSEGPLAGVGNGAAGRYAEAAIDEIGNLPSKGFIDFGGKVSGEPLTMRFESTEKFEGELDVVTYIGNGSTNDFNVSLQASTDGENWETLGEKLNNSLLQRYYKKTRRHINLTTPSYLRVAQLSGGSKGYVYDIYVIRTEGTSGIETLREDAVRGTEQVFDLFGRQIAEPVAGQIYVKNGKLSIIR